MTVSSHGHLPPPPSEGREGLLPDTSTRTIPEEGHMETTAARLIAPEAAKSTKAKRKQSLAALT
jgi:hypothetical protein